jgi:hypothetical protein
VEFASGAKGELHQPGGSRAGEFDGDRLCMTHAPLNLQRAARGKTRETVKASVLLAGGTCFENQEKSVRSDFITPLVYRKTGTCVLSQK